MEHEIEYYDASLFQDQGPTGPTGATGATGPIIIRKLLYIHSEWEKKQNKSLSHYRTSTA